MSTPSASDFSFQAALPAEASASSMASPDGSHPSSGSHTHVTSRVPSVSERTDRAITHADARGRQTPTWRERGTPPRTRTTSLRTRKSSTKNSPRNSPGMMSADAELEAQLSALTDYQVAVGQEMKQLKDENVLEIMSYRHEVSTAQHESGEFMRQYGMLLKQWQYAESKAYHCEMEFRSESTMFHEARHYLDELNQQSIKANMEDCGASLRIVELEKMLEGERLKHQTRMNDIEATTHQEFTVMQGRANQIKEEAREALLSSAHQRYHDRELVGDEVMKIRFEHDKLVSEGHALQQTLVKVNHALNEERSEALAEKINCAEETANARIIHDECLAVKLRADAEQKKDHVTIAHLRTN